jgi:hypothetical protein
MQVDALLSHMSLGQSAQVALALIEQELRDAQYKTDMAAYRCIAKGELTSEAAMNFWFKKNALYELHLRLTQKATQGTSSAQRLSGMEDTSG